MNKKISLAAIAMLAAGIAVGCSKPEQPQAAEPNLTPVPTTPLQTNQQNPESVVPPSTLVTATSNQVQQLLSTKKCQGCNLRGANLDKADLNGADLSNAILIDADLDETNLSNANLSGADLTDADLGKANLTGANLSKANFTKADLEDANLTNANVTNAIFTGADLERVIGLRR
ncbi:MAG: pentapeptide repeat-containing protein [Nostoc sp. DedVER02]|uniref:pentapeptide repeat-containing protein n=1 Tax=unclassified Nostoc TaxID=2593658 RepID=UPI002AD2B2E9|nr:MULTISPECIES: pentapeptide repeat-containing protein [unclassified Nostoc]MDZ7985968.1 pentapeptide repeat-containing protein [Nostoc sp. DedVER02]MDZ8111473.1 pentapeptide repeat-containing protein [Nostoc sp. DedVER01b]